MEDKTIDKIRKLINKQKSAEDIGSLKEAAIFAAKIQDLLTKYNLEIADIGDEKEKPKLGKVRFDDIKARKNEGQWEPTLYGMLAKFHYCMAVNHKLGKNYLGISLVGTKENIEVVKFLGDQLKARIRILEKIDWDERGRYTSEKRNTFRRGYFLGAISGIYKQLSDQRNAQMASQVKVNTLVVQTEKELLEATKTLFGNLGSGRNLKTSSRTGHNMGFERGKRIPINNGVNGKPNKSIE